MEMFDILWELPKCDMETWSWANALRKKNGVNTLAWHGVATNLQFVKNSVSAKCSRKKKAQ